jgi:hypothetical protein
MKVVVRHEGYKSYYPRYFRSPGAGVVINFEDAYVYDTKRTSEWVQMMTYWYDKEYCCLINVSDLGV